MTDDHTAPGVDPAERSKDGSDLANADPLTRAWWLIDTLPRNEFGDEHYLAVEAAYASAKQIIEAQMPGEAGLAAALAAEREARQQAEAALAGQAEAIAQAIETKADQSLPRGSHLHRNWYLAAHVARGGVWDQAAYEARSAARREDQP